MLRLLPSLSLLSLQPFFYDLTHANGMGVKAKGFVKLNRLISEQIDVLPGNLVQYDFHHFARNAAPDEWRVSPDIHNVCIADPIRQHTRSADDPIATVSDDCCITIGKRFLQMSWTAPNDSRCSGRFDGNLK